MLNRYIGNKTVILDEILAAVAKHARPGALVCDAFSGSLAVSVALKRHGYRVAANDINLFSAVYGQALLSSNTVPPVDFEVLLPNNGHVRLLARAEQALENYAGQSGYSYLHDPNFQLDARRFLALLIHLQDRSDARELPEQFRRNDIYDHYCEEGRRSAFTSLRGRRGRRRFFSARNARHIDAVLNRLRYWHQLGAINPSTEALLLTALLDAVERVANTQGTYHDFPRDRYDPRALRPMRLQPPALDGLLGGALNHIVGCEADSLDFVRDIPTHDVLYLDPPYNFRQYTAYYFLPNLLCRYPTLADPDEYFARVQYVRGQNMRDDFVSTFSKPRAFLDSLRLLIERARTKTVIVSYFDGRNHWNDFNSEPNGEGLRRLSAFFGDESLFKANSLDVHPVARLNYQSYGGYRAREVLEYLFVAEKR